MRDWERRVLGVAGSLPPHLCLYWPPPGEERIPELVSNPFVKVGGGEYVVCVRISQAGMPRGSLSSVQSLKEQKKACQLLPRLPLQSTEPRANARGVCAQDHKLGINATTARTAFALCVCKAGKPLLFV